MPQLALFIDGDNIPAQHAPQILRHAEAHGPVPLRRVYANAALRPAWAEVAGLRLMHATGKDGADFLLILDAMEAAFEARYPAVMIVSDDGGFSHLALRLRERGLTVLGLGTTKAPPCLRHACTAFEILPPEMPAAAPAAKPAPVPKVTLAPPHDKICQVLRNQGALPLQSLNATLQHQCQITLASLGAPSWRAFLAQSPSLYRLDPKGPTARVHLI
jgi:hypothetical protein